MGRIMEREFIYIGLTSLLFLTQLLGALFLRVAHL